MVPFWFPILWIWLAYLVFWPGILHNNELWCKPALLSCPCIHAAGHLMDLFHRETNLLPFWEMFLYYCFDNFVPSNFIVLISATSINHFIFYHFYWFPKSPSLYCFPFLCPSLLFLFFTFVVLFLFWEGGDCLSFDFWRKIEASVSF